MFNDNIKGDFKCQDFNFKSSSDSLDSNNYNHGHEIC